MSEQYPAEGISYLHVKRIIYVSSMKHSTSTILAALLGLCAVLPAAELDRSDIERLGHLAAQDARPTLLSKDEGQGYKYVYGDAVERYYPSILKEHAALLERAAAHHRVVSDMTRNPEVFNFAHRMYELRLAQAKTLGSIQFPDIGSDFARFMAQGMFIGMTSKTNKEADEKIAAAFRNQAMNHLGSQLDLQVSIKNFASLEEQAKATWANFLNDHPGLAQESAYAAPLKELTAEHSRRGQDGLAQLNSSPQFFYSTLVGRSSERLNWLFEKEDQALTLQVNEQKTIGVYILSDVTMRIRGKSGQERTINFKALHLVNKLGDTPSVTAN